ncbi:MAG: hypothetical protein IKC36_04680 [Clostridia bacterium]|nr:hypothetical protein [Clostridia bacterium]
MKNRTLRISLILAILTLVTSCFMGSTFAKYVTNDSGSDHARVAKFGVTVEAPGTMFTSLYAKDDAGFIAGDNTVVAGEKVVAPGTKGSLAAFSITGSPEVAVIVNYAADIELEKWLIDSDNDPATPEVEYCPIIFKVNDTELFIGATFNSAVIYTVAELEAAIEEAVKSYSKQYVANTDLGAAAQVADYLTMSWEWKFENGIVGYQNDVADTYLGDAAEAGNAATIDITVSCTVTQVD